MIYSITNKSIHYLKHAVCLTILVFGVSACGDNDSDNQNLGPGALRELNFSIIHEGTLGSSPTVEKDFVTLSTQDDYEAKLREFSGDTPVSIDFTSQRVLFLSMGEQTSGGYSIAVTRIEEFNDGLVATAVLSSPGDDCLVTSVITHPYMFVQLTSQDDDIQVFEQNVVFDCTGGVVQNDPKQRLGSQELIVMMKPAKDCCHRV